MKTQKNQRTYLFSRSLFILDFILEKHPNKMTFALRDILIGAFHEVSISQLKMMASDINQMARDLRKNQISELNKLLTERFGDDTKGDQVILGLLKSVLIDKRIRFYDDYVLIHDHLIDSDEDLTDEQIEIISTAMRAFETSHPKLFPNSFG